MDQQLFSHCPNPDCPYHHKPVAGLKKWYHPHGWYTCPSNPKTQIRRYRCDVCGKTFSETYFTRKWHIQRKDIDDIELLFEWCRGTDKKVLAKQFKCSLKTIEKRIGRIHRLAEEKDLLFDLGETG